MSNKKKREELYMELADAENTKDYLEYHKIPQILKELKELKPTKKELKPTKKEIRENELDSYYEWN